MNLTIEDEETSNEDYFKDVYSNSWINGFVIGLYFCGFVFIFGLIFVSWFERSGLSGPYRTLVNQLVIFNIESVRKHIPNTSSSVKDIFLSKAIAYYFINCGIDCLRALIGPLPSILCSTASLFKHMIYLNASLFMLSITISKYFIVCVYKSIVMNDDFIAFTSFLTVYMISFTFGLIMQLSPGRVPLNYVSTG